MRIARFSPGLISLLICALLALNHPARAALFGRSFSLSEYTAELDRLIALANDSSQNPKSAETAIDELRGDWKVEAEGHTFQINTASLVDQFETLKKGENATVREQLVARLNTLKSDAEDFLHAPADSAAARAQLTQILARSEFHQVHGPTWWDRLKLRIGLWIFHLLSRFFGSSSAPIVGRIFVWTLVAIAVIVLGWYVYRTIKLNARMETVVPAALPVSAKQWRVWLKEAHTAAAQGLWREAVHLAYWAGISFLEESGMWRPDKARTPREYLRLLPSGSEHSSTLKTLTRQLEVTWYGTQAAGPETFSETLTNLEKLGCQQ